MILLFTTTLHTTRTFADCRIKNGWDTYIYSFLFIFWKCLESFCSFVKAKRRVFLYLDCSILSQKFFLIYNNSYIYINTLIHIHGICFSHQKLIIYISFIFLFMKTTLYFHFNSLLLIKVMPNEQVFTNSFTVF